MGFIVRLNTIERGLYGTTLVCFMCVQCLGRRVGLVYLNTIDHENWIRSIMVRVTLCVKL